MSTDSVLRQPRGIVKINGQAFKAADGWTEWEVDNNTFREADTWSATFAISQLKAPFDLNWFTQQTTVSAELFGGMPPDPDDFSAADLTSYVYGNTDQISVSLEQGTITLSGRDLTSLLIDAKTTEKFQNQTASQVAKTLAARHGLNPVVTDTQGLVGKFYEIDHVSLTTTNTEWDLLCWLAQLSGFVVYVQGHDLHFEPAPDPGANPYPITWQPPSDNGWPVGNVESLTFQRTLTVGKGVVVQVRSWNQKQKKGFTATYPTSHAKGIKPGDSKSPAQVYSYVIANLTQEQANQKARALYNGIIQHEMRMECTLPADAALSKTSTIKVSGTGTAFDQVYYPESITRRLGIDAGFTMEVSAKNHSSDTAPIP